MRFIKNIEKEGSLVSYFLKETFIWKYYGVMMLLVVLSVIANLSFSYGFSVILSGNRQAAESISLVFLVFAGGKLSYTVCRFAYSQITLQLKMELKKKIFGKDHRKSFGGRLCLDSRAARRRSDWKKL